MPHGTISKGRRTSTYLSRNRAARQAKHSKNRTAVAKIQRRKYVPRVIKNTQSVYQLANAVKKLQNAQLGAAQKKSEWLNWDSAANGASYPFDSVHPFAFCLNQFLGGLNGQGAAQNTPVYYCNSVGNGLAYARFVKWTQPAFQVNPGVDAHWGDDDVVSPELYKPLGTSVLIEFQFNNIAPATPDIWMRFDVVTPNKYIPQTLHHELTMPYGLGQFTCLAKGGITTRNTINKQYWHVKRTYWIKVNNRSGATKSISKFVKINRSYKNSKPLRPDIGATDPIGGTNASFDMTIDPRHLEWLVISCGDTVPSTMKILRHMTWRDQHGTAA